MVEEQAKIRIPVPCDAECSDTRTFMEYLDLGWSELLRLGFVESELKCNPLGFVALVTMVDMIGQHQFARYAFYGLRGDFDLDLAAKTGASLKLKLVEPIVRMVCEGYELARGIEVDDVSGYRRFLEKPEVEALTYQTIAYCHEHDLYSVVGDAIRERLRRSECLEHLSMEAFRQRIDELALEKLSFQRAVIADVADAVCYEAGIRLLRRTYRAASYMNFADHLARYFAFTAELLITDRGPMLMFAIGDPVRHYSLWDPMRKKVCGRATDQQFPVTLNNYQPFSASRFALNVPIPEGDLETAREFAETSNLGNVEAIFITDPRGWPSSAISAFGAQVTSRLGLHERNILFALDTEKIEAFNAGGGDRLWAAAFVQSIPVQEWLG